MMKTADLGAVKVERKFGNETFHKAGKPLDFILLSFWQWSSSDLSNNALRGKLAEFLVAQALGVSNDVRVEWDAYDIRLDNGVTIEVKSSSYLQSWAQDKYSAVSFDIRPTQGWNKETNSYSNQARRQANYYVFCLLHQRDKTKLDPMDTAQWQFYILNSDVLNERCTTQKRLSHRSLLSLNPVQCSFDELRKFFTKQGNCNQM